MFRPPTTRLVHEKGSINTSQTANTRTLEVKVYLEGFSDGEKIGYKAGLQNGIVRGYDNRKIEEKLERFSCEEFPRRYHIPSGTLVDAELCAANDMYAAFVYGIIGKTNPDRLRKVAKEGIAFRNELCASWKEAGLISRNFILNEILPED